MGRTLSYSPSMTAPQSHAPANYVCPFCLIANGIEAKEVATVQADVVYRDPTVTAFVNSHWMPNNPGPVVIIPTQHFENLYELPDHVSRRIQELPRAVASALVDRYGCEGTSIRQNNGPDPIQEVWHYHLHVVPRYRDDEYWGASHARIAADVRRPYADLLHSALQGPDSSLW